MELHFRKLLVKEEDLWSPTGRNQPGGPGGPCQTSDSSDTQSVRGISGQLDTTLRRWNSVDDPCMDQRAVTGRVMHFMSFWRHPGCSTCAVSNCEPLRGSTRIHSTLSAASAISHLFLAPFVADLCSSIQANHHSGHPQQLSLIDTATGV